MLADSNTVEIEASKSARGIPGRHQARAGPLFGRVRSDWSRGGLPGEQVAGGQRRAGSSALTEKARIYAHH